MLKALINAFLNLFRPVHTHNYPKEPITLPKDYRGLIEYNAEDCIFCNKCEKACPPQAIVFNQNMDGTQSYNYSPYVCIYCGECVRACPKPDEALWQSEKKQECATVEEKVNSSWETVKAEAKASKEAYAQEKARKKAQKAQAAKEKSADKNPDTPTATE